MPTSISPRPAQRKILKYRHGTMGVSAVPGSGKTWTLSLLAVSLIEDSNLDMNQEILVVTLVNSAVQHFSRQISRFLSQKGLIPSLGYRVRTLHGLAHDIVKKRPDLVGLDTDFQIIDEREANRIRRNAVQDWLRTHPHALDNYLKSDLKPKKKDQLYGKNIPRIIDTLALQFIRTAKDFLHSPHQLQALLENSDTSFPLASIGVYIYNAYQRDLAYQGAIDFDDLIRFALEILQQDDDLLGRLRNQWPYILEDEAQDSSRMQERILSLLAGPPKSKNWVRVGDPNQAIYETFTTADPQYLLDFLQQADRSLSLPNSGRSTQSIIKLANYLTRWVNEHHPEPKVRNALVPIEIMPTPPGDIQGNPVDEPENIHLVDDKLSPDDELRVVSISISRWLDDHPNETVAALAPSNQRGKALSKYLRDHFHIDAIEYLNSTITTRKTSGALVLILRYLAAPNSPQSLGKVFQVWQKDLQDDEDKWKSVQSISRQLTELSFPENFVSPSEPNDWLETHFPSPSHERMKLSDFRQTLQRWQRAAILPIDQLILILAKDLFTKSSELAIAHQLANFLRQLSRQHPDWTLPDFADELGVLARNERRFMSFPEEESFHPDRFQGQVVITTAHKAKGLEWDRVYLLSANNYHFPSFHDEDRFISQKWYIKDQLNLPAESLAQLHSMMSVSITNAYLPGDATQKDKLDYVRERLRLFYVAITRARKELVITWNTGNRNQNKPAAALVALHDFWENYLQSVDNKK